MTRVETYGERLERERQESYLRSQPTARLECLAEIYGPCREDYSAAIRRELARRKREERVDDEGQDALDDSED